MKCGKKTEGENVFCPECLAGMEQYPVKPSIVVHIPARKDDPERRVRRKKEIPAEEQLAAARATIRRMMMTILALIAAVGVLAGMLVYDLFQPDQSKNPSQNSRNYTTTSTDG